MQTLIPNILKAKEGVANIFKMMGIKGVKESRGNKIDKEQFEEILEILKGYGQEQVYKNGRLVPSKKLEKFYTLSTRSRMSDFISGKS